MARPKATKGGPGALDKRIGAQVRALRKAAGMSQESLGESLGLTFQQVQKCESGANRIAISRGVQIAKALGVTLADLVPA